MIASRFIHRRLPPRCSQTKDYKDGVCCNSVKHTNIRSNSKDWLDGSYDAPPSGDGGHDAPLVGMEVIMRPLVGMEVMMHPLVGMEVMMRPGVEMHVYTVS